MTVAGEYTAGTIPAESLCSVIFKLHVGPRFYFGVESPSGELGVHSGLSIGLISLNAEEPITIQMVPFFPGRHIRTWPYVQPDPRILGCMDRNQRLPTTPRMRK